MHAHSFPLELWSLVFDRIARPVPCSLDKLRKRASKGAATKDRDDSSSPGVVDDAASLLYFASIRTMKRLRLTCRPWAAQTCELFWKNALVRVSTRQQFKQLVRSKHRFLRSVGHLVLELSSASTPENADDALRVLMLARKLDSLSLWLEAPVYWSFNLLQDLQWQREPVSVRNLVMDIEPEYIELSIVASLVAALSGIEQLDLRFNEDAIVEPDAAPMHMPLLRKLSLDGLFLDAEDDCDLPALLSVETLAQLDSVKTDHVCRFKLPADTTESHLTSLREVVLTNSGRFGSCPVKVSHFSALPNLRILDLEHCETANETLASIVQGVPPSVAVLKTGCFTQDLESVDMVMMVKALKRKALRELLLIGTFKSCADYFRLNDPSLVKLVRRIKHHTGVTCTIRLPSIAFGDAEQAVKRAYPNAGLNLKDMNAEEQNLLLSNLSSITFDFAPKKRHMRRMKPTVGTGKPARATTAACHSDCAIIGD